MKEKIKSPHPDWATSHRKSGQNYGFMMHLYEMKKVRINNSWVMEPITKASFSMFEKLNNHLLRRWILKKMRA